LVNYFEGYYDFNDANLPDAYRSWLGDFQAFYHKLTCYANRSCPGCRENPVGTGCVERCVVPACVRERGLNFCAECDDFPCDKARNFFSTINEVIGRDWENGSRRIREVGVERYFEEKKRVSHYIHYKKREGDSADD